MCDKICNRIGGPKGILLQKHLHKTKESVAVYLLLYGPTTTHNIQKTFNFSKGLIKEIHLQHINSDNVLSEIPKPVTSLKALNLMNSSTTDVLMHRLFRELITLLCFIMHKNSKHDTKTVTY